MVALLGVSRYRSFQSDGEYGDRRLAALRGSALHWVALYGPALYGVALHGVAVRGESFEENDLSD